MKIYYYFNPERPTTEQETIKGIYGDSLVFIYEKPWELSNQFKEDDIVICMSIDELGDITDLSDDIDIVVDEYMKIYEKGVTLIFDKSTQCNSMFIQTLVSDTQNFETVLRKCIYNYIAQKENEIKYSKKHKFTADARGTKLGIRKGTKLTTLKSIEMKAKIRSLAKDFGGSLGDNELIQELGISRNTYYKYKKAIKEETN